MARENPRRRFTGSWGFAWGEIFRGGNEERETTGVAEKQECTLQERQQLTSGEVNYGEGRHDMRKSRRNKKGSCCCFAGRYRLSPYRVQDLSARGKKDWHRGRGKGRKYTGGGLVGGGREDGCREKRDFLTIIKGGEKNQRHATRVRLHPLHP